jgi:hypothetical protein
MDTDRPIRFLFWNTKKPYEIQTRQIVLDAWDNTECELTLVSTFDGVFRKYNLERLATRIIQRATIGAYTFEPDAIVRREEHGVLWSGPRWQEFLARCREARPGLKSLIYDFGYFAHYKSYMVDAQVDTAAGARSVSSIGLDWPALQETVDWGQAPDYVRRYRDDFLRRLTLARERPPVDGLPHGGYVVIWPQQFLDFLRPEFKEEVNRDLDAQITRWVALVAEKVRQLGLIPVVKAGPNLPSWTRYKMADLVKIAPVYVSTQNHAEHYREHGCRFTPDITHRLVAHAAFHVVSCSSVTNELVLAEAPVVAMGRSWFSGLGIFTEPGSWDTLFKGDVVVNAAARARWVNWWLGRQVLRRDVVPKLIEVYRRY